MNDTPWLVLNQSYPPAFAELISDLAKDFGPCQFLGGASMPRPPLEGIRWLSATPYQRGGLRQRAQSWLRYCVEAGSLMMRRRPRFVFAVTNPPMLPFLALALRQLRGVPYGLLIWDIYPDHLVESGLVGAKHPLSRLWRLSNRAALRRADFVVTLGERMAETLREQLYPHDREIAVIPNWTKPEEIFPRPKGENAFAVEHDQVAKTTVLYSGNMGASHGLDALALAAQGLSDRQDLDFLLIGDGLGLEAVRKNLGTPAPSTVKLLPYQPWDRLPLSLACGDIAVVTQAPGTEHLSVPSKTYSHLAAGSAILALTDEDSDLALLVREHELGVVCPQDDPRAIRAGIEALVGDPEALAGMRLRAREAAEARFCPEVILDAYRPLFAAISEHADR